MDRNVVKLFRCVLVAAIPALNQYRCHTDGKSLGSKDPACSRFDDGQFLAAVLSLSGAYCSVTERSSRQYPQHQILSLSEEGY